MSEKVQFYYNPMSRARIVQWMLEEVGEPYDLHIIDWRKNEQKSESFLALNPMGKIPVIQHRGLVVTETAAICAYLADAFPRAGLAPATESAARGTYYRWLFFAAGCLEPAVQDRVNPRLHEHKTRMMSGYGSYEDMLGTLEHAVSADRYLAGGRFSAADVYVGAQIGWGLQFATLPRRPAFEIYLSNLVKRPAFLRAEEKANEIQAKLQR